MPPETRLSDFDFDLPESAIALRPVEPRDAARLLVVPSSGPFEDRVMRELPDLLRPGDALVFNDTRVIPARLEGTRARECGQVVRIEAMLHKRAGADRWWALARPGKRLATGDRVRFGAAGEGASCLLGTLDATVEGKSDADGVLLRFDLAGPALDEAIATIGHVPLPPYIAGRRPDDAKDRQDYQTVYARHDGAVAAPTAGLHFTDELLRRLDAHGVSRHFLTLHVGAGTFLPVKTDNVREHRMHAEWGRIDESTAAALNETRRRGGRLVAVGTTSLRLLESAAREDGTIAPFLGDTDIFITPGYRFRAVDALITNFHLPKSTLMMLVSAFSGLARMREAYAHAIRSGYRFYSYGDASLLWPSVRD